jgi:Domain of unknown function (DUF4123)
MVELAARQASRLLWPDGDTALRVFFLVDAARDPCIYPALRALASTQPVIPLYEGSSAREMAGVAPYLLGIEEHGRGFDWVWDEPLRATWGIFVRTAVTAVALRQHLQRLTPARLEDGRVVLFRFYDPRVLSVFAPTCDAVQAHELFGPIETCFAVPVTGQMEVFGLTGQGVRREVFAIS